MNILERMTKALTVRVLQIYKEGEAPPNLRTGHDGTPSKQPADLRSASAPAVYGERRR